MLGNLRIIEKLKNFPPPAEVVKSKKIMHFSADFRKMVRKHLFDAGTKNILRTWPNFHEIEVCNLFKGAISREHSR